MIEKLIKEKGLNQTRLAKQIGVHPSSVSQWVTGKTAIDRSNLMKVAHALDVTVESLLGETAPLIVEEEAGSYITGNVASVRPSIAEFYTPVKFLSVRAQAGIPQNSYENCSSTWIEETYPVFLPLVAISKRHLIIEVAGDSMEPEIKSGALVLAEKVSKDNVKYESGGVYAVLYGPGRFVIKRIRTNEIGTSGHLVLWSDNDKYGYIIVDATEIHCLWKVIYKVNEPVR